MKDGIKRALDAEAKRMRARRRIMAGHLPDDPIAAEAEALAMFRRGLEAAMAERIAERAAAGVIEPVDAAPVDLPALRGRLSRLMREIALCDDVACQRAGHCRRRQADCCARDLDGREAGAREFSGQEAGGQGADGQRGGGLGNGGGKRGGAPAQGRVAAAARRARE